MSPEFSTENSGEMLENDLKVQQTSVEPFRQTVAQSRGDLFFGTISFPTVFCGNEMVGKGVGENRCFPRGGEQ